jgi:hypothetical protein
MPVIRTNTAVTPSTGASISDTLIDAGPVGCEPPPPPEHPANTPAAARAVNETDRPNLMPSSFRPFRRGLS